MEKLEKALEKARQQRKVHAPGHNAAVENSAALQGLSMNPTVATQGTHAVSEEKLEDNRIIAHQTRSASADVFRQLRTQVLQIMNKTDAKTLAITSPNYGDGKTTTALNLAVSIAQDLKQTVLLVDLDLRKPSIHAYLDIEPTYGLTDHLLDNIAVSDCLVRLPFERLAIMPAGKHLEKSSEILGSPKMAALAHELRSRYPDRFIIYDMPPILAQDDSIAFLPHVDAVLLVIHDGVSRTGEVKRCLNILEHANVIGTVLNNAV